MKKILNSFILLTWLLINLGSCKETITQKIWSDNFFNEVFYEFLISKDGQFIIFLNNQYHYVFNDHLGKIKQLILWKKSRELLHINIDKTELNIDKDNNLLGNVVVDADITSLNKNDLNLLRNIGFEKNNDKMTIIFRVFGKRYLSTSQITNHVGRLSAPYNIRVFYQLKTKQKIAKASLTPITILLDSLYISGSILSFPFKD
ncbi:MAG: hypothetical protein ACKO47_00640 [Alphaproteobacteria bacterium]